MTCCLNIICIEYYFCHIALQLYLIFEYNYCKDYLHFSGWVSSSSEGVGRSSGVVGWSFGGVGRYLEGQVCHLKG